ncbi:hypothetical protein, partial [Kitasatospora sp. NPDC085879]|uniref:hypothetical protein n=1 Tax=Kitasatospora sp. NPDC085879 TaxID=3154769 RepID=UPI00342AB3BC
MTTNPALTQASRRGLFTTDPDDRLRTGTLVRSWELWLTGPKTWLTSQRDAVVAGEVMKRGRHHAGERGDERYELAGVRVLADAEGEVLRLPGAAM